MTSLILHSGKLPVNNIIGKEIMPLASDSVSNGSIFDFFDDNKNITSYNKDLPQPKKFDESLISNTASEQKDPFERNESPEKKIKSRLSLRNEAFFETDGQILQEVHRVISNSSTYEESKVKFEPPVQDEHEIERSYSDDTLCSTHPSDDSSSEDSEDDSEDESKSLVETVKNNKHDKISYEIIHTNNDHERLESSVDLEDQIEKSETRNDSPKVEESTVEIKQIYSNSSFRDAISRITNQSLPNDTKFLEMLENCTYPKSPVSYKSTHSKNRADTQEGISPIQRSFEVEKNIMVPKDVKNAVHDAVKSYHDDIGSLESINDISGESQNDNVVSSDILIIDNGDMSISEHQTTSIDGNWNSELSKGISYTDDSMDGTSNDSLIKVEHVTSDVSLSGDDLDDVSSQILQKKKEGKYIHPPRKRSTPMPKSLTQQNPTFLVPRAIHNRRKIIEGNSKGGLKLPNIINPSKRPQLMSSLSQQTNKISDRKPMVVNSDDTDLNISSSPRKHRANTTKSKKNWDTTTTAVLPEPTVVNHVPRFLKAHALYKNGQLEVTVTDENKSLPEKGNIDIRITVLHKHINNGMHTRTKRRSFSKLNFAPNRDVLKQRAQHPPMNTYIDEEQSERFRKQFSGS